MIAATSRTAGAGNSQRALRWLQRASRPDGVRSPAVAGRSAIAGSVLISGRRGPRLELCLGPDEHVLELLLCLGSDLGGRRPLDRLLDRHADDVAVLGDGDDLRQSLTADLERGLVGLIPV